MEVIVKDAKKVVFFGENSVFFGFQHCFLVNFKAPVHGVICNVFAANEALLSLPNCCLPSTAAYAGSFSGFSRSFFPKQGIGFFSGHPFYPGEFFVWIDLFVFQFGEVCIILKENVGINPFKLLHFFKKVVFSAGSMESNQCPFCSP